MVLKKCDICDRKFKKTEHYKRHERSHTKERPYECSVCHKRFSRSDVLSRHAKGHAQNQNEVTKVTKATNGVNSTRDATEDTGFAHTSGLNSDPAPIIDDQTQLPRRRSSITTSAQAGNPSENQTQLLPDGTDALADNRMPQIPTPRDINLAPPGGLSSNLDFLADISVHQHRTEPPQLNPMMIGDNQTYFPWGNVPAITSAEQQTSQRPISFDAVPNEMLQLWLEPRTDSTSHQSSIDYMRDPAINFIGDNFLSPDRRNSHSVDPVKSGDNIPNERFTRVERCWFAPSPLVGRLINTLWRDISCFECDNLFTVSTYQSLNPLIDTHPGTRFGLDDECRARLQSVFSLTQSATVGSHTADALSPTASSTSGSAPAFPPAEILDMALDLYFRHFHPLVPFVHMPTFCAKATMTSLLFVMCQIGMTILGTKGSTGFVMKTFPFILDKISSELSKCAVGNATPASIMSTFAAAFLMLNLAAMTGEKLHLQQSQMVYINLMSVAQRHGLFLATEGQTLDMALFEAVPDLEMRWKAWSRVESAKRLIVSLLSLDSWYSSFLSTSPIIVPEAVQLVLPCHDSLFKANSSSRWMQLIRSGKRILMPMIKSPSETIDLPNLDSPVDDISMHGLLATIQLRLSESYHRLLSKRASFPFAPCHTYAMDARARCLPSLQMNVMNAYSYSLERMNPNCLVMWHHMCMSLTADMQIFDLAAGRDGAEAARAALDDIAAWSQTPAARRACLHAAEIYKALSNRKASDDIMFYSAYALFSAALVLGLYTFMVVPQSAEAQIVGAASIEVLDDIDWQQVDHEGFSSILEPGRGGGQPFTTAPTDIPAVKFIRNGGTIYIRGVPHQGGYQSARRILLDYGGLLKDTGKWSVRKFAYVLHIMSDVLMDVD